MNPSREPSSEGELSAKMTMLLGELALECRQYLEFYSQHENTTTPEEKEDAEIQLVVFASQLASTIEQIESTDQDFTDGLLED
jgi:hypothetical protein